MDISKNRNVMIALALMALMLFGWDSAVSYFYPNGNKPKPAASAPAAEASG